MKKKCQVLSESLVELSVHTELEDSEVNTSEILEEISKRKAKNKQKKNMTDLNRIERTHKSGEHSRATIEVSRA